MKTKGTICIIILFLLLFYGNAFSYDLEIKNSIPIKDKITGISVNPVTGKAAIISGDAKSLYIIDPASTAISEKIALATTPTGIAIDSKRNIAIIASKEGKIDFIDLEKKAIISTTPVEKGIYSIAVAQDNNKALLGTQDSLIIIDLDTRNIIREIPLSFRVQRIIENNGNAIVSGYYSLTEAVLQNIDISKGEILKEASLSKEIANIDIDKNLGIIIISQKGSDKLLFYDLNLQPITDIALAPVGEAAGLSINPSTHIAVLTDSLNNSISIIDIEKIKPIGTTSFTNIGTMPGIVFVDPSSNTAFISYEQGIVLINLENPVPKLDKLVPSAASSGDGGLSLSIEGSKFIKDTQPQFNKRDVEGNFSSNEKLQAKISQQDLSSPGEVPVTVTNPPPGGGISSALTFKIYNPAPVLDSITPDAVPLTSDPKPLTLRVNGRNFFNGSTATLNGINLRTRFISSILLEAEINPSDIKTVGRYTITVINPSPAFASSPVYLDVVDEARLSAKQMTMKSADGPPGTLKGRILNTNKKPVVGATIKIKNISVQTDSNGNFMLNNVPSGKQHVMIHGETAMDAESRYPTIPLTINIEPGKINEMPFQIYLHKQKNRDFKQIEHNKSLSMMGKEAPLINRIGDLIVTDKEHPGVELKIPKGASIIGWDGKPNTKVSIRTVPSDRLPIKPLSDNAKVRSVYMFYFNKAGGGTATQPIPFKAPNDLGLLPGDKAILWYYDESPNEGEAPNDWAIAGTGTVTSDGRYIVTDPDVGIPKFCCGATGFGCGGACPPGPGPGCP